MVHCLCVEGDQEQTSNKCIIHNCTEGNKEYTACDKVAGFVYIAQVLKPFLLKYKTDAPMMMFLGEDLQDTCQMLMQTFVNKSILDSAGTAYKVAHLDVLDTKNHRSASDIDI